MTWFALRREIARGMPTIDIRCAVRVGEIKTINWRTNSLNGYPTEFGITFMFMSSRFMVFNGIEEERRSNVMAETFKFCTCSCRKG